MSGVNPLDTADGSTLIQEVPNILTPLWTNPSRITGIHGGRGSTKSTTVARFITSMGWAHKLRIACLRQFQTSIGDSVKSLIEGQAEKTKIPGWDGDRKNTYNRISGSYITYMGFDRNIKNIKGLEDFDLVWIEEADTLKALSIEILEPTIRKQFSRIIATWNPGDEKDPIEQWLRGSIPAPNSNIIECNYWNNPWFPQTEMYNVCRHAKRFYPMRYRTVWRGEYGVNVPHPLWVREWFRDNRLGTNPINLTRIVVAVDPAATSHSGSDEHGIIVCGMDASGVGYVLEDRTIRGRPTAWGREAADAYDRWDADAMVIETNQGGDMAENNLRLHHKTARIIRVHAARAKHVRAEPISALYEQGRVHHVGNYPELENQLLLMSKSGYHGKDSPDRADALIWGLTELLLDDRPSMLVA